MPHCKFAPRKAVSQDEKTTISQNSNEKKKQYLRITVFFFHAKIVLTMEFERLLEIHPSQHVRAFPNYTPKCVVDIIINIDI